MSKAHPPELKKYMDKRVKITLSGARIVIGRLRGFDPFMNTVIDEATDESSPSKPEIGMVVIRGNSIMCIENMDADGAAEVAAWSNRDRAGNMVYSGTPQNALRRNSSRD